MFHTRGAVHFNDDAPVSPWVGSASQHVLVNCALANSRSNGAIGMAGGKSVLRNMGLLHMTFLRTLPKTIMMRRRTCADKAKHQPCR